MGIKWRSSSNPEEIVMIKCEICGKECKDLNGLSTHLRHQIGDTLNDQLIHF